MHEASLARELLMLIEGVAREHRARAVSRASLQIGEIAGVDPDALTFAFSLVSRGTVADGCRLDIARAALVVHCPACGWEGPGFADLPGCPSCEHVPVDVRAGREMTLVSIDVEDEDADPASSAIAGGEAQA